MSERRARIHTEHALAKTRRCALLEVARSSAYYRAKPVNEADLVVMRLIDEIHLRWPFYGSRRLRDELESQGHPISRKRVHAYSGPSAPPGLTASIPTPTSGPCSSESASIRSTGSMSCCPETSPSVSRSPRPRPPELEGGTMALINDLYVPNIGALLADDGDIDIGYLHPVGQVAVASDDHHALAMLRRRPGVSLANILLRLDVAIETAIEHGEFTDEINP